MLPFPEDLLMELIPSPETPPNPARGGGAELPKPSPAAESGRSRRHTTDGVMHLSASQRNALGREGPADEGAAAARVPQPKGILTASSGVWRGAALRPVDAAAAASASAAAASPVEEGAAAGALLGWEDLADTWSEDSDAFFLLKLAALSGGGAYAVKYGPALLQLDAWPQLPDGAISAAAITVIVVPTLLNCAKWTQRSKEDADFVGDF